MNISFRVERAAWLKAMILAAALGLFSMLNAPQALATHVGCGDTITEDTTLDSDLLNCPGPGLVIGADKITLDLNGHTISGQDAFFRAGVENGRVLGSEPGYRGVTIENGVIQGFDRGISLQHSSHGVVRGLTLRFCGFPIDMDHADKNRIEDNSISDAVSGILLETQSHKNRIVENSISNAGFGISLFLQSNDNRIARNVVSRGDSGISVFTDRNRIEDNSVSHSLNGGIEVGGTKNRIEGNDASWTSGREPRGVGIWISFGSVGAIVRRNIANHNEDDGIRVLSSGVKLAANTANFNGDLGIQAVEGVRDGGRNSAFGNGNPLQCLNVACR
jgi:parallel beta-helix repeat protein